MKLRFKSIRTICAAIMMIVLAFNFLGNGLLDVLDPKLKKQ